MNLCRTPLVIKICEWGPWGVNLETGHTVLTNPHQILTDKTKATKYKKGRSLTKTLLIEDFCLEVKQTQITFSV